MAFGSPYKYVYLEPTFKEVDNWDEALLKSDDRFNNEEHNLFLYNTIYNIIEIIVTPTLLMLLI